VFEQGIIDSRRRRRVDARTEVDAVDACADVGAQLCHIEG
jgi:hypothetical protein